MKTSEKTDKLFPLLMKAKAELKSVGKDSNNPHFKSRYASLNAHLDEADAALGKHGLMLLQPTGMTEQGVSFVESVIIEPVSGQFISSSIPLVVEKQDMQKYIGAVTYGRRGTLSALLGMQAEDLDGEDVVGRGPAKASYSAPAKAPAALTPEAKAKVESGPTATGGFKKPGSSAVSTPATNGLSNVVAKKPNPVTDSEWT